VTLAFRHNPLTHSLRLEPVTGMDLKAVDTFTQSDKVKPTAIECLQTSAWSFSCPRGLHLLFRNAEYR